MPINGAGPWLPGRAPVQGPILAITMS